MDNDAINFSVIVPTWNRSPLVCRLLDSISTARINYNGHCEILIVDSSEGDEQGNIAECCVKYDAVYIKSEQSVRKKRNTGILSATNDYIIFVDSDVTVCSDFFNQYDLAWRNYDNPNLGGVFGLTEFVGKDTFIWKIITYTGFLDSFRFAKMFPYQQWTIGNNVSFKKSVILEVHMFEEAFPFKLGGDDLDMSYRITKAGYRIKSLPEAVTYHSKETWYRVKAINDRTKRWGAMEYYLSIRHPEIFIHHLYRTELILFIFLIIVAITTVVSGSAILTVVWVLWFTFSLVGVFFLDASRSKKYNLILYSLSRVFAFRYYLFHVYECLKHKSLSGFTISMSFSPFQTKFILWRETTRIWIVILALALSVVVTTLGVIIHGQ